MGNLSACGGPAHSCAGARFTPRGEPGRFGSDEDTLDVAPAGTVFKETLQGIGAPDRDALLFAGTANAVAVRWLLERGACLDACDASGTTLLHAACRSGSSILVQDLVRLRALLDVPDAAGWTPLHVAAVMGRRDVAVLLLRRRASPASRTRHGESASDLSRDPFMRELLDEHAEHPSGSAPSLRPPPRPFLADMPVSDTPGFQSHDLETCEPFFVPRESLFSNEACRKELARVALEVFDRSPGHGLALLVACGVVPDKPMEVAELLRMSGVNRQRLGEFLGEEYSLSQTLRLAFVHGVRLEGTGVIGALAEVFGALHPPEDLLCLSRIVTAVALLWWRAHGGAALAGRHAQAGLGDEEGLDWRALDSDFGGAEEELAGAELFEQLRSRAALCQLMFSAVMLCRAQRPVPLSTWLRLNAGIEADGGNVPVRVLRGLHRRVTSGPIPAPLLPAAPPLAAAPPGAAAAAGAAEGVHGWAAIPRGGFLRGLPSDGPRSPREGAPLGASCRLAGSVVPESAETAADGSAPLAGGSQERAEPVWLSLRLPWLLLLAPSPGAAPYALVRLSGAALLQAEPGPLRLLLGGAPDATRGQLFGRAWRQPTAAAAEEGRGAGDAGRGTRAASPPRLPLPVCLLLADGCFQPLAARWLELQFDTSGAFECWREAIEGGCACE